MQSCTNPRQRHNYLANRGRLACIKSPCPYIILSRWFSNSVADEQPVLSAIIPQLLCHLSVTIVSGATILLAYCRPKISAACVLLPPFTESPVNKKRVAEGRTWVKDNSWAWKVLKFQRNGISNDTDILEGGLIRNWRRKMYSAANSEIGILFA